MLGKGFVRVIEIVIFSFILFVLLLPNFFYFSDVNDFSKTNNLALCNDLLFSIEINKIFDDVLITDPFTDSEKIREEYEADKELLLNITEKVFPLTVDFEYEIKNVASYQISIGCNCTTEQIRWLEQKILTPSYPTAEYAITGIALSNLSATYDLFIIFNENNLSEYKQNIEGMLEKGKGFVLIRNFSSEPDQFTKEIFVINYSASLASEEELKFNNLSRPETARIAKRFVSNLIRVDTHYINDNEGTLNLKNESYFVKQNSTENCTYIQNCSDCLYEGETCTTLNMANITLYQIDPLIFNSTRVKEWIDIKISGISNKRDYTFKDSFLQTVEKNNYTILTDGNYGASNARTLDEYSSEYKNRPRVFWIYDYNKEKDDLNLLLKTGIIWASGEHYFVSNKEIPAKVDSCIHFYSGLRGNNIPFLVKLYFWGY